MVKTPPLGTWYFWMAIRVREAILRLAALADILAVGECKRNETYVEIYDLEPLSKHNVRVDAVSAHNFQSRSSLIYFITHPRVEAHDANLHTRVEPSDGTVGRVPKIRASIPRPDPFGSATAPSLVREHSSGHGHGKRVVSGRRISPAGNAYELEPQDRIAPSNGPEESIAELTERLEALQRVTIEEEEQIVREDEDYQVQYFEAVRSRDEKKQALKEREENSSDLRKQVAVADRANRAAQSKKATREKSLQQKRERLQKMHEDKARWSKQVVHLEEETVHINEEKEELRQSTLREIEEIREKIAEEHRAIRALEEDIRLKGVQLKDLEEERKRAHEDEDDEDAQEAEKVAKEEDAQWNSTVAGYQHQYRTMANQLAQVCTTGCQRCTHSDLHSRPNLYSSKLRRLYAGFKTRTPMPQTNSHLHLPSMLISTARAVDSIATVQVILGQAICHLLPVHLAQPSQPSLTRLLSAVLRATHQPMFQRLLIFQRRIIWQHFHQIERPLKQRLMYSQEEHL